MYKTSIRFLFRCCISHDGKEKGNKASNEATTITTANRRLVALLLMISQRIRR